MSNVDIREWFRMESSVRDIGCRLLFLSFHIEMILQPTASRIIDVPALRTRLQEREEPKVVFDLAQASR